MALENIFCRKRLSQRPFAKLEKVGPMRRMELELATFHHYIETNPEHQICRIVFDIDYDAKIIATQNRWEETFGVPEPSWIALTRDNGHCHLAYELDSPVWTTQYSPIQQQLFIKAIEKALVQKLKADRRYAGFLCKNPLHTHWQVYTYQSKLYSLSELHQYVELPSLYDARIQNSINAYMTEDGQLGRNNYIFENLRKYSYKIYNSRNLSCEQLTHHLFQVGLNLNHFPESVFGKALDPLQENEISSIAKSIANWTCKKYDGRYKEPEKFKKIQSARGKSGAKAVALMKRSKRLKEISVAIDALKNNLQEISIRSVARQIGCAESTLREQAEYRKLILS